MHTARALVFFVFLLPGCAIIGSERYFAAGSDQGKPEWTGNPGIIHLTGQPDSVRYVLDDIAFSVHASPLSYRTYSIGPCLPVPLPVIPLFGLYRTEHGGPVQISFHVLRSKKQHQLIRAVLVADDRSFSPEKITVSDHASGEGKPRLTEALLPLLLIDGSTYMLTYNIAGSAVAAYELVFYLQGDSGTVFFRDKISLHQDSATTFVCVFP
ncbi:MAG: hypothetical protein ACYC7L_07465 [Nitrospirota bacterium]